jgi:cation:H+ antiporter
MDLVLLAIGVVLAAVGGDRFVRGAVGLAAWARIPAGIVGATLAAFATSAPELSVSVNASLAGQSQLALGDALGSNVVNVGLVLGLALAVRPIRAQRLDIRRDFPVAVAAPVLTALLALDGQLSRVDAGVLLVLFATWLVIAALQARNERSATEEVLAAPRARVTIDVVAGLIGLVLAGRLIVAGAKGVGDLLGLDPFVVGATLVALGTSAPELATTISARLKGHDEIGLGTVIGSNIFNGCWIVGVAALIRPIPVQDAELLVGLLAGLATMLVVVPGPRGVLGRGRGAAALGIYAIYVVALLAAAG